MSTLTLRLHGLQEEIVERMVAAGLAETRSEAIRIALLDFARSSGLVDEEALFESLQGALRKRPRSDAAVRAGVRRAKRARVPRR